MDSYCVYRHVAPNGKMYVGVTRQSPECRWKNGNGYANQSYLFNAIKKYGWDNFKHEILLNGLTADEASLAEKLFIGYWDLTNRERGYNNEEGGLFDYHITEETRQKKSISMIGKNAGERNGMYGKHLTQEQKDKISKANLGKIRSQEARRKMSQNRPKKVVLQFDIDTGSLLNVFESTHDAYRQTGVGQQCICRCCNHKAKTAGGYRWEYDNEYIKENGERRCMP